MMSASMAFMKIVFNSFSLFVCTHRMSVTSDLDALFEKVITFASRSSPVAIQRWQKNLTT